MRHHRASNEMPSEKEEPLPHDVLESPRIQAQIAANLKRIAQGTVRPGGKTAEDLLSLAREQHSVDPRPHD